MLNKDVLKSKLEKEAQNIDMDPMYDALEDMLSQDYWESKNIRLNQLIGIELIASVLLTNTIGYRTQIQELIGKVARQISTNVISYVDMIRNATNVIEALDGTIFTIEYGKTISVVSNYQLTSDTYDYIDNSNYHPPMLVEPKEWTNNSDGGYYTTDTNCIIGSPCNMHKEDQALNVLNKLQSITWELDPLILSMEEEPNKAFVSPDSHEQFKTMKIEARKTYIKYEGKPFWFIWQFDKRGRQYSKGYHINLQASGYKKASLNFYRKQLITGEL